MNIANDIPHRSEGEGILLEYVPLNAKRILDLGTGDGRLVKLLKRDRPNMHAVALDISQTMIRMARDYFAGDDRVKLVEHDLSYPLPELGLFDAVSRIFFCYSPLDTQAQTFALFRGLQYTQSIWYLMQSRACGLAYVRFS
ncbi:MAG: class I SAM-dependent methyltransferase [Candidatus Nitrosopolaris sp.]